MLLGHPVDCRYFYFHNLQKKTVLEGICFVSFNFFGNSTFDEILISWESFSSFTIAKLHRAGNPNIKNRNELLKARLFSNKLYCPTHQMHFFWDIWSLCWSVDAASVSNETPLILYSKSVDFSSSGSACISVHLFS